MEKEEKINLFRIITTIILFAITFIPSLNSNIKISLYIISYLVIGGDILINAIKNIFKGELFDENFLMSLATVGALVIGEYPEQKQQEHMGMRLPRKLKICLSILTIHQLLMME